VRFAAVFAAPRQHLLICGAAELHAVRQQHVLHRLQWSTRALAAPADVQLALYPDFVDCADQLALDYGEALYQAMQSPETASGLRGQGRELLLKLDDYLNQMSTPERKHLWSNEALQISVEWAAIRATAGAALVFLNWPSEPPPASSDVFVPGSPT
jgi:hypothetical protein